MVINHALVFLLSSHSAGRYLLKQATPSSFSSFLLISKLLVSSSIPNLNHLFLSLPVDLLQLGNLSLVTFTTLLSVILSIWFFHFFLLRCLSNIFTPHLLFSLIFFFNLAQEIKPARRFNESSAAAASPPPPPAVYLDRH
jgi:hypothetical protein